MRRMRYQPHGREQVGGDRLARGLVSLVTLAGKTLRDAADRSMWTATAATTPLGYSGSPRGRGLSTTSGTPSYVSRPRPASISTSTTQPVTFRYRVFVRTLPNSQYGILCWANTASDGRPRYYARINSTNIEFYYSSSGGVYRTPTPITAQKDFIITHTFDGTTHRVYKDGVEVGNFAGPWGLNANSFFIGRGYNAVAGADFQVSDFAVWNRALSADEVRRDAANPWSLFMAPRTVRIAPPAAGIDVSPGPATPSVTGYAPTIEQSDNHAVSPGAAAPLLVGYAPTVEQSSSTVVAPGPAAPSVIGYAPTVEQSASRTVSPAPAAPRLVGYAPMVEQTVTPDRYAYANRDIATGPWQPSSGTTLAAVIDEPSADASDYIEASMPGPCEVALSAVLDPGTSSDQVVRYQAWSDTGGGLTVRLKQGAAVIAEWPHASLPPTPTVYAQVLTAAQCDSITDYTSLSFEFEAT